MPHLKIFFSLLMLLNLATGASSQGTMELSRDVLPDFRQVVVGHHSDVQFYYLDAEGLEQELTITADPPFRVSLDCYGGFSEHLVLEPSGDGSLEGIRIFVRLFAEDTGLFEGVVSHRHGEDDAVELQVSGEGTGTSIPQGYYEGISGSGSELKTQLHHLIKGHQVQSYASIWQHFGVTDATFDGFVWDIYSNTPCEEPPYLYVFGDDQDTGTGGTEEGDVYNREHSMPRSWFGGAVDPMNTDLYHIYPVDKFVNAQRANFPFGMVDNPFWTSLNGGKLGANVAGGYAGTAFEPIDEYKGDLARTFFYMITRYEDRISSWTYSEYGNAMFDHNTHPGYEPWVINMLMDWHEHDPVSQRERLRNQAVYGIQGNRNPFVDHPEWVEKIWGDTTVHTGPEANALSVSIYPNPAVDQLGIISSHDILKLQMFAHPGVRVKDSYPGERELTLDVSHLPAGVYILRLKTRKGVFAERIMLR